MALKLYYHPFASFCQKVLIALYENGTSFEPVLVDLGNPASRAELERVWPRVQFPVLVDESAGRTLPESTIIIEYLHLHYPGPTELLPADPKQALRTRLWERFYDLHVDVPMQKVVTDNLRPEGSRDPFGVTEAARQLRTACAIIDRELAATNQTWAAGDIFSMADCAAAPALYYVNLIMPLAENYRHAAALLDRLMERPSFARVLAEARPFLQFFPMRGRTIAGSD
jgi:glutathione S-transferase